MPKYYVECGDIKDVLNAEDPLDACTRSVVRRMKLSSMCNLLKTFTVNEKGFVSDRVPLVVDSVSEEFIDTKEVFDELGKKGKNF